MHCQARGSLCFNSKLIRLNSFDIITAIFVEKRILILGGTFMAQYDPKILRKLQGCELDILKDFIKICEENNLTYFGFAGTAIGAIRHGGFIPWYDDIDS